MDHTMRTVRQAITLFGVLAMILALAWWANGQAAVANRSVPCLAEDACELDYRDGAWHVGNNGTGANNR